MTTRIGTKAHLIEENARLRAELEACADVRKLNTQLAIQTAHADRMEARVDKQAAELAELYETQKHLDDGTWTTLTKEREEIATLLDCEPADIVETLRTLRDDMGCDKGDTLLLRADTLTSEAASYEDAKEEADLARERADSMDAALTAAIADRRALLERLGFTDYAWSAQGGACWADIEV
jgi:hypothetical protein